MVQSIMHHVKVWFILTSYKIQRHMQCPSCNPSQLAYVTSEVPLIGQHQAQDSWHNQLQTFPSPIHHQYMVKTVVRQERLKEMLLFIFPPAAHCLKFWQCLFVINQFFLHLRLLLIQSQTTSLLDQSLLTMGSHILHLNLSTHRLQLAALFR